MQDSQVWSACGSFCTVSAQTGMCSSRSIADMKRTRKSAQTSLYSGISLPPWIIRSFVFIHEGGLHGDARRWKFAAPAAVCASWMSGSTHLRIGSSEKWDNEVSPFSESRVQNTSEKSQLLMCVRAKV